jgi:hypothetical protein
MEVEALDREDAERLAVYHNVLVSSVERPTVTVLPTPPAGEEVLEYRKAGEKDDRGVREPEPGEVAEAEERKWMTPRERRSMVVLGMAAMVLHVVGWGLLAATLAKTRAQTYTKEIPTVLAAANDWSEWQHRQIAALMLVAIALICQVVGNGIRNRAAMRASRAALSRKDLEGKDDLGAGRGLQ